MILARGREQGKGRRHQHGCSKPWTLGPFVNAESDLRLGENCQESSEAPQCHHPTGSKTCPIWALSARWARLECALSVTGWRVAGWLGGGSTAPAGPTDTHLTVQPCANDLTFPSLSLLIWKAAGLPACSCVTAKGRRLMKHWCRQRVERQAQGWPGVSLQTQVKGTLPCGRTSRGRNQGTKVTMASSQPQGDDGRECPGQAPDPQARALA